jgi:DNA mismatch repair protein MutL
MEGPSETPRTRIAQLPPNLVNRIAAGEVIERPASVVKECVENSLDAGATSVTVEIDDGGKALIRILDNGNGIPADDLPLAFASHATSKLRDDADLFAIRTMGFRGEALASIGSVSFARIVSRTPDSDSGYEITNRGGEMSAPRAIGANVGTSIEVRDLFYNVPARRKFLKGSGTESGHVADAILKIAIARPDVSFKLLSGGRISLDLPATAPTLRWLEAWPSEYAQAKLDLSIDSDDISLRGIVGLPELAMPHLKNQYLYINGRCVRDKFIGHALKEAFRGLCEPGRNPAAVLMIALPADQVDVNVHPTKSEVRFRDSSRVHGLVLSSVRSLLLGNDLVPRAKPQAAFGNLDSVDRTSMREQLASFFRADVGAPSPLSTGPLAGGHYLPDVSSIGSTSTFGSATSSQRDEDSMIRAVGESTNHDIAPTPSLNESTSDRIDHILVQSSATSAIQLHNSYLVAESEDGLVIIDQHALHERIMFEDLLARVQRGPLEAQRLLIPLIVSASPQQIDALESLAPIFAKLGIEAAAIGPDAVAVHAFPSFLEKLDPAAFVKDVLEKVENESAQIDHETLLHETLDMMSCKAAVKAGDPLTPDEIKALLARRHLVDRASNCPHGRPTTLKLSLRDLEKQFKRTGF